MNSVGGGYDKVILLSTKSNLGFARGNNFGIDYVRNNFDAKYICCLNNDTLIEQIDFYKQINHIFKRTNAAVIGPCVHVEDGSIQQFTHYLESRDYYVRLLEKFERIRRMNYRDPLIERIKKSIIKNKVGMLLYHYRHGINDKDYYDKEQKNVVLQGCCLIFTPVFFSRLNGFCSETFLYFEEQILTADILKAGLVNIYTPKISIRHLEGKASKTINKSSKSKRKFYIDNSIDSLNVLLEHM